MARSEGLLLERINNETVAYDVRSNEAHCLAPLASVVFDSCDGAATVDDLTSTASAHLGRPVDSAEVVEALAQLEERQLLSLGRRGGMSRRDLMRRGAMAGAAALAVPLVTTITAPMASAAASQTCGNDRCCPCFQSSTLGQPCCRQGTTGCTCTAAELTCKQCKAPKEEAALDKGCLETFSGNGGFPTGNSVNDRGPCTCKQSVCTGDETGGPLP